MNNTVESLRQFRLAVYQTLWPSRDAAFDIIDAIAASRDARSAVEVSLSPTFQRSFASVYKGIQRTRIAEQDLTRLLVEQAESCGTLNFDGWALYALDHTPYPRQSAPTVSDRGYVHGADGVVIGHHYSLLGRVMYETGSWVGMVCCQRIATYQTPSQVGAAQIERLKAHSNQPRIITADSEYVTDEILDQADETTRLLIRFRSNRKLFSAPEPRPDRARGRKPIHGQKIKLNQQDSLQQPQTSIRIDEADGRCIEIGVWTGMHVESRPDIEVCAVRVEVFTPDKKPRYKRPLWLCWTGPAQMDWGEFWRVYLKRFCLECVHQFTKNSLAWTRGRFGYTGREQRWTWLVMLAYWQLLLAAPLARDLCRPWEKAKPDGELPTPGRVQREWVRLYREVGRVARPPKVRGKGSGRAKGSRPPPRLRYEVVCKSQKAIAES